MGSERNRLCAEKLNTNRVFGTKRVNIYWFKAQRRGRIFQSTGDVNPRLLVRSQPPLHRFCQDVLPVLGMTGKTDLTFDETRFCLRLSGLKMLISTYLSTNHQTSSKWFHYFQQLLNNVLFTRVLTCYVKCRYRWAVKEIDAEGWALNRSTVYARRRINETLGSENQTPGLTHLHIQCVHTS